MIEKILLAPGVNGSELLRTLALHGQNSIALRVMGTGELAEYALMMSGEAAPAPVIGQSEASALLLGIMREIPYFVNISFADAADLAATLRTLREQITYDEPSGMHRLLTGGEFPEANAALLEAYDKYMSALEQSGRLDITALVRLAAEKTKPLDARLFVLEETRVSPLGRLLALRASGESCRTVSMRRLFEYEEKPLNVSAMTRSYGSMNEARDVLDRIIGSGLSYDSCTAACADRAVTPLMFYELSKEYGVPMTFGCGLPLTCTYPASLLKTLRKWCTDGMYGTDALDRLIFGDRFDTGALMKKLGCSHAGLKAAVRLAGGLRLSFSAETNRSRLKALRETADRADASAKVTDLAESLFSEFEKGMAHIIGTYSVKRYECLPLDCAAADMICRSLSVCKSPEDELEMIPYILSRNVLRENSREGCLHITDIPRAAYSLRKNLFVTGLSASRFPGTARENHLICDTDMLRFGADAPTSLKLLSDRKKTFGSLIDLASAAGSSIYLSYSGFDTSELKENNASSLMFEVFRRQHGSGLAVADFERSLESKGYFSAVFSSADRIGKAFSERRKPVPDPVTAAAAPGKCSLDRSFSVSDAENYLSCPARFMYGAVFGLRPDPADDPLDIISDKVLGTLFHDKLMAVTDASKLTEDELAEEAGRVWNDFLLSRPPINPASAAAMGRSFRDMARASHKWSCKNEIVMAEKELTMKLPSGLTVKGRLDRLEKLPDGTLAVADFKTGRSGAYKNDDFDSCVQVMLYAYMLEKQGVKVARGEYRLAALDKLVTCTYTDRMRNKIGALLNGIADSVKTGSFGAEPNKKKCRSCPYKEICEESESK